MLYLGDCRDVMDELIDRKITVDMILTDLPYEVTASSKDKMIPFEDLWPRWNRLIKENACIALFAQGLFYVDMVMSNRKDFK